MKNFLILFMTLFGMQTLAFAVTTPSWNDFTPSVVKKGDESYWESRYREFESALNDCKALPQKDRNKCYENLSASEREKNKNFYVHPSIITAKSTARQTNRYNCNYSNVIVPIHYRDDYWDDPYPYPYPYPTPIVPHPVIWVHDSY